MRTLCSLIVLWGLLSYGTAATAAPQDAFPSDRPGCTVVDRATLGEGYDGSPLYYGVLYKADGLAYVDIYRARVSQQGADWKLLYRWKRIFQGQPMPLSAAAILNIRQHGKIVGFSVLEHFRYQEGRVSFFLELDTRTGKFTEGFAD